MSAYKAIAWRDGLLRLLDQRVLPHAVAYTDYDDYHAVASAIRDMVVRGAPAIGTTGAYGLALAANHSPTSDAAGLRADLQAAAEVLRAARPTAVNLAWALDRVLARVGDPSLTRADEGRTAVLAEADAIAAEDAQVNRRIGLNALSLVPDEARIIHHCNTGSLATVDYGTALGIIRTAHEHGKQVHVFVDETRPRLQGARLTAWELQQLGVAHTVIVDGAAAHIMRTIGEMTWK